MDPITIAALAAMVAGAGVQYKASSDAQARQKREIAASLQAQRELQMQAEKKSMDAAQGYAPEKRIAEQTELADGIEQSLIAPVSESQAIRSQQSTTQGDVSGDYSTAKAASDLETVKQAQTLARLLGKTTSASRLRMNEGIRLMDTGQAVDQLAGFSRGRQVADNIAIQQAGQLDPGKVFAGQLLSAAGSAGLMYGGSGQISGGDLASANASADPINALAMAKDARTASGLGRISAGLNGWASSFERLPK